MLVIFPSYLCGDIWRDEIVLGEQDRTDEQINPFRSNRPKIQITTAQTRRYRAISKTIRNALPFPGIP
jgi:hypothetical protein